MNTCKECGKPIGPSSQRCRTCANRINITKRVYRKTGKAYGPADPLWRKNHVEDYAAAREKNRQALLGKRKISDEELLRKALYREQCQFNLAGVIERVEGYELLKLLGMYDRRRNPEGVVRDHIYSVARGFKEGVDPRIISHPANCRFITHKANASKSKRCDISLEDLQKRIEAWDGLVPQLAEGTV